jgi:hypothetical protein
VGWSGVVGVASRYGVKSPGDRILEWAIFSAPVRTGLRARSALYTLGIGSFPGVKRPERVVVHRTQSSADVVG